MRAVATITVYVYGKNLKEFKKINSYEKKHLSKIIRNTKGS